MRFMHEISNVMTSCLACMQNSAMHAVDLICAPCGNVRSNIYDTITSIIKVN